MVGSYLLAPGYFQTNIEYTGADVVLSIRARVENDYPKNGFDSIDGA